MLGICPDRDIESVQKIVEGQALIQMSRFVQGIIQRIDVSSTLKDALKAAKLTKKQRPKLLSDNGPCYVSEELRTWLSENGMPHTRGKPYHPMTQGKIERWHRTMKNTILLENYYFPEDLIKRIGEFVTHYNTRRYHESLNNLTPE